MVAASSDMLKAVFARERGMKHTAIQLSANVRVKSGSVYVTIPSRCYDSSLPALSMVRRRKHRDTDPQTIGW